MNPFKRKDEALNVEQRDTNSGSRVSVEKLHVILTTVARFSRLFFTLFNLLHPLSLFLAFCALSIHLIHLL